MINIEKDLNKSLAGEDAMAIDKEALENEITKGNEKGLEFLVKKSGQYTERFSNPKKGYEDIYQKKPLNSDNLETFRKESGIKLLVSTNMLFEGGKLSVDQKKNLSKEVESKMKINESEAKAFLKVIIPSIEGQWDSAVSDVGATIPDLGEKTIKAE